MTWLESTDELAVQPMPEGPTPLSAMTTETDAGTITAPIERPWIEYNPAIPRELVDSELGASIRCEAQARSVSLVFIGGIEHRRIPSIDPRDGRLLGDIHQAHCPVAFMPGSPS